MLHYLQMAAANIAILLACASCSPSERKTINEQSGATVEIFVSENFGAKDCQINNNSTGSYSNKWILQSPNILCEYGDGGIVLSQWEVAKSKTAGTHLVTFKGREVSIKKL